MIMSVINHGYVTAVSEPHHMYEECPIKCQQSQPNILPLLQQCWHMMAKRHHLAQIRCSIV